MLQTKNLLIMENLSSPKPSLDKDHFKLAGLCSVSYCKSVIWKDILSFRSSVFILMLILSLLAGTTNAQQLDDYSFKGTFDPIANEVRNEVQFNGYTNYWHNDFKEWIRYGNLFKMSLPNVRKTIAQSKIDLADDLQIPGLSVQEGFVSGLFSSDYKILEAPSVKELEESVGSGNVLVFTDPGSDAGKKLISKFVPDSLSKQQLKSYQFGAVNFREVNAFILENGAKKGFCG